MADETSSLKNYHHLSLPCDMVSLGESHHDDIGVDGAGNASLLGYHGNSCYLTALPIEITVELALSVY
jgi:hypothetical protein